MTLLFSGHDPDVYGVEPLPADHPPQGLPNLVATPHRAGARRQVAPQHCTNPEVLDR